MSKKFFGYIILAIGIVAAAIGGFGISEIYANETSLLALPNVNGQQINGIEHLIDQAKAQAAMLLFGGVALVFAGAFFAKRAAVWGQPVQN
ncbi:hypothetical protein [Vibrio sp. SCSIO 43136]|uniref:hypothetical protein n=1 Tax=Vibrio sp. SCSIO 43136 TaxID=2819101 RepID=UPI00207659E6|nr:hypothetical protein [Vibrio sp. SCSIO 43136]USD67076.1 hypothetical protein J4N39_20795 [Vibrio sp. SCSIO 43136]